MKNAHDKTANGEREGGESSAGVSLARLYGAPRGSFLFSGKMKSKDARGGPGEGEAEGCRGGGGVCCDREGGRERERERRDRRRKP